MSEDKTLVSKCSCSVEEMKLIRDDPNFRLIFDCMKNLQEDCTRQSNDSLGVLIRRNGTEILIPPMFAAYPDSPTAQRYMEAFNFFFYGWEVLRKYPKDIVESEEDCDILQPAFHAYSYGDMCEQHLFSQFRPPEDTTTLINQYLKFRPNDILVEYFKVAFVLKPDVTMYISANFSDFDFQKKIIVTGEEFIHRRQPHAEFSEVDRHMLKSLYYHLGAVYVTTNQEKRALDSFQKCYDLDKTNVSALYGIAHQYFIRDPEKAITLFQQYIDRAPVCDKQYPNAHYMLAFLYIQHYKNRKEAFKYCDLAEKAEEKRLSFLCPVDIPQKKMMQTLKSLKF